MELIWLPLLGNLLALVLVGYVLYLLRGMASDLNQIRQILERETGET